MYWEIYRRDVLVFLKTSNDIDCPICMGFGRLRKSFNDESIPCEYCNATGKITLSKQREYLDHL